MNMLLTMTEIVILACVRPYILHFWVHFRPKMLGMGHLTHPTWRIEVR